jgi:hypothetical protein
MQSGEHSSFRGERVVGSVDTGHPSNMPKGCTILGIRHRDEEQAKLRRGDVLESKRKVTVNYV